MSKPSSPDVDLINFEDEKRKDKVEMFRCNTCGHESGTLSLLNCHEQIHIKKFSCETCNEMQHLVCRVVVLPTNFTFSLSL